MKSVTLVLAAVVFLFGGDARGQGLRGSFSGGAGRGGFAAPAPAPGAPAGLSTPGRPLVVVPQQPALSQPGAQPQSHVAPGRPGASHLPQPPIAVVPSAVGGRLTGGFGPSRPGRWWRDRFFWHRHGGVAFFAVPEFVGTTVVITEVAPGVLREDRRYVQDSPANAPVREPGQVAPFDPTPQEVVQRMLALADVRKNDVIYDLGSGDGRLLIAAAKKYGVRGVGFEIDAGLVKLARENARREGVEKLIEIRQQDFLAADLSRATVVTLYLSYDGNLAVREQLNRQLKPGARVVSYTFDMGDWPPKIAESYRDAAGETHAIYLWEIGAPALARRDSQPMLQPYPTSGGPLIIEVQ